MKQAKQTFRSGDVAPVSGNYQFVKHDADSVSCVVRVGAYVHLMKGMKLPLHDECQEPSIWSLMTVTQEEHDPKIIGM
jgi:hypothetical protein